MRWYMLYHRSTSRMNSRVWSGQNFGRFWRAGRVSLCFSFHWLFLDSGIVASPDLFKLKIDANSNSHILFYGETGSDFITCIFFYYVLRFHNLLLLNVLREPNSTQLVVLIKFNSNSPNHGYYSIDKVAVDALDVVDLLSNYRVVLSVDEIWNNKLYSAPSSI